MARSSRSRASTGAAAAAGGHDPEEDASSNEQQPQGRTVAAHVRDRQRAVTKREASRLARPEARNIQRFAHADRKKSAVTSTPFGIHRSQGSLPAEEQEWCGPWSIARQMIDQREEAKRKREEELEDEQKESHPLDELMDLHDLEQQKQAHPSMTWKGSLPETLPSSTYAKRQKRIDVSKQSSQTIPTLCQLCVNFVVANFDYIESLGYIDNDVRISDLVLQFLQTTGDSLETINLSHNYDLTDSCLSGFDNSISACGA
jgi:hypothetical protein